MVPSPRPHLLGVDDGPFEKRSSRDTPVVAVVTEGADLVEGVAVTRFPIDGADATAFLAAWIRGLRFHPILQATVLGGITIAGLGIVDVPALARDTRVPVIVVNRRDPSSSRLSRALRAAGLEERIAIVERSPQALRSEQGLWVACAGIPPEAALALVEASSRKAGLPEPLRLAHLIASAIRRGESRGRA